MPAGLAHSSPLLSPPLRVRGINRVYLSTYFAQTSSVAWHWLAGVFCLSLSQSRPTIEGPLLQPTPAYHHRHPRRTGCSLWRRKKSQNSHFQRTYRRLFPLPLLARMGRTPDFDMTVHPSCWCLNGAHQSDQSLLTSLFFLLCNLTSNE